MSALDIMTLLFLVTGTAFFAAGSVGLLRFPDAYTRLHALTKADNLGLGFIVVALVLQSDSIIVAGKLLLTWALVLITGAAACHIVANAARTGGVRPWRKP